MKAINLPNGRIAVADDEDFDRVNCMRWNYYPVGKQYVHSKGILLHRFITNPPEKLIVDHINGNPFDNRKVNLRICDQQQNMANVPPTPTTRQAAKGITRTYKGVHAYPYRGKKYKCTLSKNGNLVFTHYPDTIEEGARAYDAQAIIHNGEYAYLNFPRGYEHILPDRLVRLYEDLKLGFIMRPEDYE